MKKLTHLFVAAVFGVTIGASFSTRADEPLLSPRAQLSQARTVPSGTSSNDRDLVKDWQNLPGSPKAKELAFSLRKVPSTGRDIDLAHALRPTLSPKDPRFEVVLRENALNQIQVAPLK